MCSHTLHVKGHKRLHLYFKLYFLFIDGQKLLDTLARGVHHVGCRHFYPCGLSQWSLEYVQHNLWVDSWVVPHHFQTECSWHLAAHVCPHMTH